MAVAANNTGMIILGGGVAKHHICNANSFVSIFHSKKGQPERETTFNVGRGTATVREPMKEDLGQKTGFFFYIKKKNFP